MLLPLARAAAVSTGLSVRNRFGPRIEAGHVDRGVDAQRAVGVEQRRVVPHHGHARAAGVLRARSEHAEAAPARGGAARHHGAVELARGGEIKQQTSKQQSCVRGCTHDFRTLC